MNQPAVADRARTFPIGASVTVEQLTGDPRPVLAALRATEPVSWVPALGAWLVTDRELCLEAMRDAERFTVDDPRFTTGVVLGPSMLSLDGPEHERHRSPFAAGFRPGVLRRDFERFLDEEVSALLSAADGNGTELRSALAGPLAVNTITRFLGLEGTSPDEVLGWYRSIAKAITDLTVHGAIDLADRVAVAQIHQRVQATLGGPATDSLLRAIEAGGALRPDELGSSAAVLMFGAIETSEGMTTNLLWHLLHTEGAWAAVDADRSLLTNAVEESLRSEPAAAVIDRYTTIDATLGPVVIPAGELVTISLLGANHDPTHFDDPDAFLLRRANARQHLTFVQGPHACLGLHLARMEATAAVSGLLDRAPAARVDHGRSTPPAGLIFRKPDELWVSW